MADEPNVAGAAGGDTPAATDAGTAGAQSADKKLPAEAAADAGTLSALADDDAGGGAPQDFPDNWRELLAGKDEDALSFLKRFGSVQGLYKKVANQEKLIREAKHKVADLPEDASPEEIAAFRKAAGVPENPEGYGLKFTDAIRPTEADTELLQDFQKDMHGAHMTPAATKAVFQWYQNRMLAAREAQAASLHEAKIETQIALRQKYGRELKHNLGLVDEFLEERGLAHLLTAVLPNGKPVDRDAQSLETLIELARSVADEDTLHAGDGSGGGKSLDDEYKELIDKSAIRSLSASDDKRLRELADARQSRAERQGRSRAA